MKINLKKEYFIALLGIVMALYTSIYPIHKLGRWDCEQDACMFTNPF